MTKVEFYKKEKGTKTWIFTAKNEDKIAIEMQLRQDLTNKYLLHCRYITRITQECIYGDVNHRIITVYFIGGTKRVYTVPA